MPYLGNHLNFSQYEARNMAVHNGNPNPPSGNVKGQLFFNNSSNELFYWDGTIWQSAKSGAGSAGPPSGPAGGDLTGTYPNPTIAPLKVTDAHVAIANKDGAAATPSMRTLGLGAQQAMPGNTVVTPADATTGTKGIVQLAGDLAGTAASPQIAAGVITHTEVAAANIDGTSGIPSMRRIGFTTQYAMPGTATLADIATNNLAAAAISVNSQKITNLATPTAVSDAANKQYVDTLVQGLDPKPSVRVVATASVGAGGQVAGTQTIDGVAVTDNDRVLLAGQATPAFNGIWTVVTGGSWNRAADVDTWPELVSAYVFVESGTANADSGWVCTVDPGGTLGTTAVTWTQFSGAGQITAGAGLAKTGNQLDVGAGAGITVNADTIQVANNGITNAMLADGAVNLASADVMNVLSVSSGGTAAGSAINARANLDAAGYYSSATHGAGTAIAITRATHNCRATRGLLVQVQDEATGAVELSDVAVAASGDVTVTFGASVAANSKRVTVIG